MVRAAKTSVGITGIDPANLLGTIIILGHCLALERHSLTVMRRNYGPGFRPASAFALTMVRAYGTDEQSAYRGVGISVSRRVATWVGRQAGYDRQKGWQV
jgi:hypothetical protein